MSRKELKVCIRMRPSGGIFVSPDVNGDIIVYEDQMTNIMHAISKCRTRGDALEVIRDFGRGLDIHHSDVKIPVIRKKITLQSKAKANGTRKDMIPSTPMLTPQRMNPMPTVKTSSSVSKPSNQGNNDFSLLEPQVRIHSQEASLLSME